MTWWPRIMSAAASVQQPLLHSPTSPQYTEQCLWCRSHFSTNSMTPRLPTALQAARQQVQPGSYACRSGWLCRPVQSACKRHSLHRGLPHAGSCVSHPPAAQHPACSWNVCPLTPSTPAHPACTGHSQAALSGAHLAHFIDLPRRLVAETRALRWTCPPPACAAESVNALTPCSQQLTCRLFTGMPPCTCVCTVPSWAAGSCYTTHAACRDATVYMPLHSMRLGNAFMQFYKEYK